MNFQNERLQLEARLDMLYYLLSSIDEELEYLEKERDSLDNEEYTGALKEVLEYQRELLDELEETKKKVIKNQKQTRQLRREANYG